MKRIVMIAAGALLIAPGAFAQGAEQAIETALMAAPANMKADATVVKWNADFTYEVLKKGTNALVCYDQSGEPGEQPVSAQCTSLANLPRVAQNRKFEKETDRAKRQAALDAAEKDGTRVKPEFGSMFRSVSGPDKDHLRTHTTIAVPGATATSLGIPDNNKMGGAWIMNAGTSTAHLMVPGS